PDGGPNRLLLGALSDRALEIDLSINPGRLLHRPSHVNRQDALIVLNGAFAVERQRFGSLPFFRLGSESARQFDAAADVALFPHCKPFLEPNGIVRPNRKRQKKHESNRGRIVRANHASRPAILAFRETLQVYDWRNANLAQALLRAALFSRSRRNLAI